MKWSVDKLETDSHISGGRRIVWVTYKHTQLGIYKIQRETW